MLLYILKRFSQLFLSFILLRMKISILFVQEKENAAYIYKLAYQVYSSGCKKKSKTQKTIFYVLMIDSINEIIVYLVLNSNNLDYQLFDKYVLN